MCVSTTQGDRSDVCTRGSVHRSSPGCVSLTCMHAGKKTEDSSRHAKPGYLEGQNCNGQLRHGVGVFGQGGKSLLEVIRQSAASLQLLSH